MKACKQYALSSGCLASIEYLGSPSGPCLVNRESTAYFGPGLMSLENTAIQIVYNSDLKYLNK